MVMMAMICHQCLAFLFCPSPQLKIWNTNTIWLADLLLCFKRFLHKFYNIYVFLYLCIRMVHSPAVNLPEPQLGGGHYINQINNTKSKEVKGHIQKSTKTAEFSCFAGLASFPFPLLFTSWTELPSLMKVHSSKLVLASLYKLRSI